MAFRRSLSYSKYASISQQIYGVTVFEMVDMAVGFVMNHIRIFLSSEQNEFAIERKRITDYIRQDHSPR